MTDNLFVLLAGILLLSIGVLIPRFKLYWLIAGLNGLTKKQIERYNLRYIEKYFGFFMKALGALTIINPVLWVAVGRPENIGPTIMITTLSTIAIMFLFGLVNRNKIYHS